MFLFLDVPTMKLGISVIILSTNWPKKSSPDCLYNKNLSFLFRSSKNTLVVLI